MNVSLPGSVRSLWPLAFAVAVSLRAAAPVAIDTLEKTASDWVKVRAETTRLENEWSPQRQLLESMVNGLGERAAQLEEKRDYLKAKTAGDREELENLRTANLASADDLAAVEAGLRTLTARLTQLRPALPPRLSAALELSYQSLAGTGLGLGERMQLTMTVLNRCTQFNRAITCEEELVQMDSDQPPRMLEVIYWGLSHAYALDKSKGAAWFGSPGPQGWHWEPLPQASSAVARLIAVYQGNTEPEFVEVPARLGSQAAEPPRN
ncbi:MAG TPA: DUF3450 family protein [Candidatus Didemnitutus sp.]|jgi:hypothetical protein